MRIALCFIVLLLAGCSTQAINDDIQFRIEILYAHTLQMDQISSKATLEQIGLDLNIVKGYPDPSPEEMVKLMEDAFGMKGRGSIGARVSDLEKRMDRIMEEWAELEGYDYQTII